MKRDEGGLLLLYQTPFEPAQFESAYYVQYLRLTKYRKAIPNKHDPPMVLFCGQLSTQ